MYISNYVMQPPQFRLRVSVLCHKSYWRRHCARQRTDAAILPSELRDDDFMHPSALIIYLSERAYLRYLMLCLHAISMSFDFSAYDELA